MERYNLIQKGDTVYLGFEGNVCKFRVQRVDAEDVWLSYDVDNVTHVRKVSKARCLALLVRAA